MLLKLRFIPKSTIRTLFTEISNKTLHKPLIKIRNENFLPGASSSNMPEYIQNFDSPYLKAAKVEKNYSQLRDVGKDIQEYVEANINQYSALLIKHLPYKTVEDVSEICNGFTFEQMTYKSGSGYRDKLAKNVYSASEEPKNFTIEPHNEMAYLENYPAKILLFCTSEATEGGESPVTFNRDVINDLDPAVVDSITKRKIRYMRNITDEKNSDYLTWQATFETKSREQAEQEMIEQNTKWEWKENGDLSVYNICEAVQKHPATGETVWFNQATGSHCSYYHAHPKYADFVDKMKPHEYPVHCTYGDGEEFEDEIVDHIRSTLWKNSVATSLQQGDVFILDNMLAMHSRMAFKGPRKILIQMFR